MGRRRWILLALLAATAALVAVLATRTRKPPFLPADPAHAEFTSVSACLVCHGPDGAAPRSKEHPLGNDCLRCHAK